MNNKKIIVIGGKWWGQWAPQLVSTLNIMGVDAKFINVHKIVKERFYHHWKPKSKYKKWREQKRSELALQIIQSEKPDYVISVNMDCLNTEALSTLKSQGIKTFIWIGDAPYNMNTEIVSAFDEIAIWDSYYIPSLSMMTGRNIKYLPTCGDDSIFKPMDIPKDIDVLFIGGAHGVNGPIRSNLIISLYNQLKSENLSIRVIGDPGWNKYLKDQPEIKSCISNIVVTPQEACKLYNRSKIVLNIHHPQNIKSTSARTYEIALSKAYQISDYKEDIDRMYTGSIDIYNSIDELVNKIKKSLNDKEYREEKARLAYEKTIKNHTFRHRIENIFEILE